MCAYSVSKNRLNGTISTYLERLGFVVVPRFGKYRIKTALCWCQGKSGVRNVANDLDGVGVRVAKSIVTDVRTGAQRRCGG
jgi:hypothetical protein